MDYQIFEPVLWDVSKEEQDKLEPTLYVKRALVYGNLFLIAKVLKLYGLNRVLEVFNNLKETEVGTRKHYYLKNYFLV
ncbi:MAG: hypothetical protein Q7K54_03660 [Candidatus Parcubacteria bacterium]|nr:hypothetical protein [Candidatus Parcubacteria bacterium]